MAIVQQSVNICGEVDSLLAIVLGLVQDVKAGKAPSAIVADVTPLLIVSLEGLGGLSAELADKKDLYATVALKGAELISVLVP